MSPDRRSPCPSAHPPELIEQAAGARARHGATVRVVLDTHVVLWWLVDDPALSTEARMAIADPGNDVLVSAASVWEIAIKQALGKLRAPGDLLAQFERHRFRRLPVTDVHALRAGALPRLHDDPFDRMLVAQAAQEGLCIATRDPAFAGYGVPLPAA